MAYRKPQRYFSFADLAVEKHADKNRALAVLKQLNLTIDWNPLKKLLDQFYQTGKQIEGGKAYPPVIAVQMPAASKIVSDPLRSRARKPDQ